MEVEQEARDELLALRGITAGKAAAWCCGSGHKIMVTYIYIYMYVCMYSTDIILVIRYIPMIYSYVFCIYIYILTN